MKKLLILLSISLLLSSCASNKSPQTNTSVNRNDGVTNVSSSDESAPNVEKKSKSKRNCKRSTPKTGSNLPDVVCNKG